MFFFPLVQHEEATNEFVVVSIWSYMMSLYANIFTLLTHTRHIYLTHWLLQKIVYTLLRKKIAIIWIRRAATPPSSTPAAPTMAIWYVCVCVRNVR